MAILKDMMQITSFVEWTIKYLKYLLLVDLTFCEYINSNIFNLYSQNHAPYLFSSNSNQEFSNNIQIW